MTKAEGPRLADPGAETAIAGYRVTGLLSRQPPWGRAYEAIDPESGRPLSVWVLGAEAAGRSAEDFREDARRLSELGHKSLLRVLDSGSGPEGAYVVTELAEGTTLADLIGAEGPLRPMRVVRFLGEIAAGIDAAHGVGLLHRGISASSVVVGEGPVQHAVLQDFALGLPRDQALTASQTPYVSPEELRGEAATSASDVYSLACLAHQSLTGQPPDAAAGGRTLGRDLPNEAEDVLRRGRANDPSERPASASELVAGLAAPLWKRSLPSTDREIPPAAPARADNGASAPGPPWSVPSPEVRPARRRRGVRTALAALAGLAVIGAAGELGYLVGKRDDGADSPIVKSGSLSLPLPAGWRAAPDDAAPSGLRLEDGLSARRPGGGDLTAGLAGQTALPARIARRVDSAASRPETVRFGNREAYRWPGLRSRAAGRTTLFVSPTSEGLLVVLCSGPRGAGLAACERLAGTLSAPDQTGIDALAAYSARVRRAARTLNRRRISRRGAMRRADTRRGRASVAVGLARAHLSAAAAIRRAEPPPHGEQARDLAVLALRRVAASYRRLAGATSRGGRRRYGSARRSVIRRERALRAALRGL